MIGNFQFGKQGVEANTPGNMQTSGQKDKRRCRKRKIKIIIYQVFTIIHKKLISRSIMLFKDKIRSDNL